MFEEFYSGPKFNTVFLSNEKPECSELNNLIHWCSLFHSSGLTPSHEKGTAGNLSFRLSPAGNAFYITAAGLMAKCRMKNRDFVVVEDCDLKSGKVFVRGTQQPSSESLMHFQIYLLRPEINAVFHGHHQLLVKHAGDLQIPVTEMECGYGTTELARSIVPVATENNFFILRNHGFVSLGESMDMAGKTAINNLRILIDNH